MKRITTVDTLRTSPLSVVSIIYTYFVLYALLDNSVRPVLIVCVTAITLAI